MLNVSTQMVPTPVSVWRTTLATDAPAGPGEPHSPRLSCTSTTNSPKGPSLYNLNPTQSHNLGGSNEKRHSILEGNSEVFRLTKWC